MYLIFLLFLPVLYACSSMNVKRVHEIVETPFNTMPDDTTL